MTLEVFGFTAQESQKLTQALVELADKFALTLSNSMSGELLDTLHLIAASEDLLMLSSISLLCFIGLIIALKWTRASCRWILSWFKKPEYPLDEKIRAQAKTEILGSERTEVVNYDEIENFSFPKTITSIKIIPPTDDSRTPAKGSPAWRALNKSFSKAKPKSGKKTKTIGEVFDSIADG